MNTSGRGTGRKNQNVPRESTSQDISHFLQRRLRRSQEDLVEIDDDDEVQVLTDQFAFADEDLQPIPVKRRKKNLIFEDSDDDDLDKMEGMDEDEKRQMKEAIRQSKLQMEVESMQRAAYTTKDVKLISEAEPAKSGKVEDNNSDLEDETQDYLSVPSSPASSGVEKQQEERAESPELFGTPRSSNEHEEQEDIPDQACSSSKSPFKSKSSFSSDDRKVTLGKGIIINLTPVKSKNKLKLKKKESSRDQEKEAENISKYQSKDQNKDDSTVESKKRKHSLHGEDDDTEDDTQDTGREFIVKDPKKKQKTIAKQVFNVKHMKKEKQEGRILDPPVVVMDDDDDDYDGEGSMEDDGIVLKRNDSTTRLKKSTKTRLERVYSKPRLSIKTIKDAMKARLFFAPPGIEPQTYTYAIMRMMDHTRKCIYRAQRKSLNFIKWGKPIVAGPRETNSLDAWKEKKKSNVGVASTSAFSFLDVQSLERKSSLRSAQKSTAASPIKTEPVKVSAREGTSGAQTSTVVPPIKTEPVTVSGREGTSGAQSSTVVPPIKTDPVTVSAREGTSGAQTSTVVPPIKTEPVTVSAREGTRKVTRDYLNSDESDDDDLSKSVFGETTTRPKPWKEYLSSKQSESFGENVITSTEYKEKSANKHTYKRDLLNNNAASSSFTGVEDVSKNVTETEQNKVDENDGECMNETRVKLENTAETNVDYNSPMKFRENSKNAERQENDTPIKQMKKQRTMVSELEEEEEIDSSIEIGMNKSKKHVKKALIKDMEEEEEENSHGPLAKFKIKVDNGDVVRKDHDLYSTTEPPQVAKPGASLTNIATKSGYLKAERTPTKIPEVRRVMLSAARRAAEAAEKRMRASSLQSSPDISSNMESSQEAIPSSEDSRIECPICFSKFFKEDIETHAATCERTPTFNPTSFSPSKPTTSSEPQKSIGSPTAGEDPKNKDFGLKNLRVMVKRSPEAHRRLMKQKSQSASKARRNLSLNKAARSATNDQGSENRRARRYIDVIKDDENSSEIKKENSVEDKETSDEDSQTATWFSTTASQMERKKNKFKVTYGGKKKRQVADPSDNPFATLDHMHLEQYPSSDDVEQDAAAADDDDGEDDDGEDDGDMKGTEEVGEKSGMTETIKKKSDTSVVTVKGAPATSLSMEKDRISSDKYGGIDSDSDDSDIEMLATYGVTVASKKRKFEDKNSINDILQPQRQANPKKKKKRAEGGFDDDDYENEMALLELSGVTLKRSKVENKSSERSTKGRRRRTSSSEESEDNDFEKCYICFDKVPKEQYKDHTDICLKMKGEYFATPGKDLCQDGNSDISSRSRSTVKQSRAGSSEQTIEMDSDEIGDSPVKTFKLIGEDSGSCIDFGNQFAFFNKGGETRRKSKGYGRNKGGKHRGKGRYRRGRGKRKH